jgi:hypothetical protein
MAGTGTTAPPERSNAASAAGWALIFVFAGWALGIGAVMLWYEAIYPESGERECSGVFSCMTTGQTVSWYLMLAFPVVLGSWLVASVLVLLAQLSRGMRSWHPAVLGALTAFIVLAVAGGIVLNYLVDEYMRYR